MKFLILLFSLIVTVLVPYNAHSQMREISKIESNQYETCEEGTKGAELDFQNNVLVIPNLTFNYTDNDYDWEIARYFETYMLSKYDIELEFTTCIYQEALDCYYNRMITLIETKYGKDFLKNEYQKILNLYPELTRYDKALILDFSKVYSETAESMPKFNGNDYELEQIVKKYLVNLSNTYLGYKLLIGTKGNVLDIILNNKTTFRAGTTAESLLNEINSLGTFIPAYLYDEKVRSYLELPSRF